MTLELNRERASGDTVVLVYEVKFLGHSGEIDPVTADTLA